ncbi:hypothetical protein AB0H20_31425 [Nocardia fluminea]|uniref:hypothetical protein n=1 Tax=Nocardia fluminea TaxID=134984 RepID=UPI0033CB1DDB
MPAQRRSGCAVESKAAGRGDGIFANGAVTDGNGAPIGKLILWVRNGWLSAIELA